MSNTFCIFVLLIPTNTYTQLFLYDDNATAFLPFYTYNWNSVINNLTIPFINFHQYLGHTYFSQGQTGVLYPPIYLAVLLSKLTTGSHFFTIDILVLLHFCCSVVGMFFLLKRFNIDTKLSFIFSLIWIPFPFFHDNSKVLGLYKLCCCIFTFKLNIT